MIEALIHVSLSLEGSFPRPGRDCGQSAIMLAMFGATRDMYCSLERSFSRPWNTPLAIYRQFDNVWQQEVRFFFGHWKGH